MDVELIELSQLRSPDPGETTEFAPVAESGETTEVPRIELDPAVAQTAPRRRRVLRSPTAPAAPLTAHERRSERAAQRLTASPAAEHSRPARRNGTAARRRGRAADWLLMIAAVALLGSLFLPWSHQFSAALLARFTASPILFGVPRDPNAWQVYSIVDALLALLAVALGAAALIGGRTARLVLSGCVLIALAFTIHALRVAPTNGANIVDAGVSTARYYPNSPRPGTGEDVAVVALGLSLVGVALTFTGD